MKTHLAFSESPIGCGSEVRALCGAKVEDSVTVAVWDEQAVMESITFPVGTCGKCLKAVKPSVGKQYAYAVRNRS